MPWQWVLLLLLPLKSGLFMALLLWFRLRGRTALHTSLSLSSYSEFGLIVVAAALAEGRLDQGSGSAVAVAVAASFVLASTANRSRYALYAAISDRVATFMRTPLLAEDAIVDYGPARVLVFGMGRVGTGAYDELARRIGSTIAGVDRRQATVERHQQAGRQVVRGDALDRDFWDRIRFQGVELVVIAMDSHPSNLECVQRAQEFLPQARIAAIATYSDQVDELRGADVDVARNLYEEAGQGLADDAIAVVFDPQDPGEDA